MEEVGSWEREEARMEEACVEVGGLEAVSAVWVEEALDLRGSLPLPWRRRYSSMGLMMMSAVSSIKSRVVAMVAELNAVKGSQRLFSIMKWLLWYLLFFRVSIRFYASSC